MFLKYTQVNSKIGNFANPGAPDLRPAKQALSEGNRADAAGRKCGDAGEGKNPSFEFSCVYCDHPNCVNFDSARQSQIEAQRSERGRPFPVGKADEEDRFGKVAASQNSHNWGGRGIY